MGIDWDYERSRCWSQPESEGSITMNRDHQKVPDLMKALKESMQPMKDSTPPATPVEPPEEPEGVQEMREHLGVLFDALWRGQFDQIAQRRAADQLVGPVLKWLDTRWPPARARRASHPPAVLGEGERLKEQAAAYRAIALDALACWQGEDEHSDDNQKRNRSARSRATLRHRICAVDDTLRASTPTPGAEGR